MRRYELRFITQNGRKIRGPIFGKKDWGQVADSINDGHQFVVFRMHFGRQRCVIPQAVLENGYFEIKPIGMIHALARLWRSW